MNGYGYNVLNWMCSQTSFLLEKNKQFVVLNSGDWNDLVKKFDKFQHKSKKHASLGPKKPNEGSPSMQHKTAKPHRKK